MRPISHLYMSANTTHTSKWTAEKAKAAIHLGADCDAECGAITRKSMAHARQALSDRVKIPIWLLTKSWLSSIQLRA